MLGLHSPVCGGDVGARHLPQRGPRYIREGGTQPADWPGTTTTTALLSITQLQLHFLKSLCGYKQGGRQAGAPDARLTKPELWWLTGWVLAGPQNQQEAEAVLRTAVEVKPTSALARGTLAGGWRVGGAGQLMSVLSQG
jgi:hypothetical protein